LGSKLTSAGRAPSLRVCLTSEEKVRWNLSFGRRKVPRYPRGSCPVYIHTQTVHIHTQTVHSTEHT
jgi:hypothetical protein